MSWTKKEARGIRSSCFAFYENTGEHFRVFSILLKVNPSFIPREMSRTITQMPKGNPRTFDSGAKNPSPHLPHGLSLLNSMSILSVQEEADLLQATVGLLNAKRFKIFNEQNQMVLYAAEDDRQLGQRFCCGTNRTIVLRIYDQSNQEVIRMTREFLCCGGGCVWCADTEYCKYEAIIESPPGVVIGSIRQRQTFFRPQFSLNDAAGREHLRIIKPFCICQGQFCCCCENKFKLTTVEADEEIGAVYKEYAGFVNQAFTGAEKFTLKVPIDMPAHLKAIALGALFVVDYRFFGRNAKSKGGTTLLSLCC